MPSNYPELMTQKEIEQILHSALTILQQAGCIYQSGDALDSLGSLGCQIDKRQHRAFIPTAISRKLLKKIKFNNYFNITGMMGYSSHFMEKSTQQNQEKIDFQKIIHFASSLTGINILSSGFVPSEQTNQEPIARIFKELLENSTKPFLVPSCSLAQAQKCLMTLPNSSQSSHKIKDRCYGLVQISTPLHYSESNLQKLSLYAKYNQAICLEGNYTPASQIPVASLLALQIAEWIAGYCYLESKSFHPTILYRIPPSFSGGQKNGVISSKRLLAYHVGILELAKELKFSINLPYPTLSDLDFYHGWMAGFFAKNYLAKCSICFYPLNVNIPHDSILNDLILQNEFVCYLQHIISYSQPQGSIDKLIDRRQQKKYQLSTDLFQSKIFRSDMFEVWRREKIEFPELVSQQVEHQVKTLNE